MTLIFLHHCLLSSVFFAGSFFQETEIIEREGLTVPVTTALLQELKAAGLDVPTDALSIADCADAIANAIA